MQSRRAFVQYSAATVTYAAVLSRSVFARANALGLPLGLQLYSVREQLPKDYEGTLRQLAAIGYREVEAAGFFGHDPAQVNAAMKNAGLHCVSAHYGYDALYPHLDEIIEFGNKIGLEYLICSFPGHKTPPQGGSHTFTIEDWRWNADQFNRIGEKVSAAGMRFGYHNHTMEFVAQSGVVPYDELLRLTDPKKVTMEMDCGWVIVGGANPVEYFQKYPTRFSMLHVKDFKKIPSGGPEAHPPIASELGQGAIDYGPIFAAAHPLPIRHVFVEQEEFDMPPMDSLRVDAAYMEKFKG